MAYPPTEMISADTLHDILTNPMDFHWRSHGIGMLRTYLDPATKNWRLNLWHGRLLNPGISTMHTHPWSFGSYIIAGRLTNTRWIRSSVMERRAKLFMEAIIPCGDHAPNQHDAGPLIEGEPRSVYLEAQDPETYTQGHFYVQEPEEIHTTLARDGTITVMHRSDPVSDGRASVFWPHNTPWGDASRGTSVEDVLETCAAALEALRDSLWRTQ